MSNLQRNKPIKTKRSDEGPIRPPILASMAGRNKNEGCLEEYKNLTFFLARTEEVIQRASDLIGQLEIEMVQLKYEVEAMHNEHKNLKLILLEQESAGASKKQ